MASFSRSASSISIDSSLSSRWDISSIQGSGTSFSNDEADAEFWLPPVPENWDDDIIGSVANYDDDDECGDSVTGAKHSPSSSFGEDDSGNYKFKEENLEAMNNVRNGKFTALVSRLVKSVGVDSSGSYGDNWVDIVTSLSWEAASFVKTDTHEGKAMDPDGYVKIKCIASGLRTQSELIKGLVFKKRSAHKHMPTKYKNPRLLLIHGSLDLSSGGLSSFESMLQERNSLRSIIEMIEMYHPNVVLVEKSVSRDIQESILAKGMTLVFEMKLHRLDRVARCIGSPILPSEVAIGQKLRQCDSFRIEKFVEEHAVSIEGGKKPSKTLMFLEGSPSRHGCTILLMGANSDELKRIKCVVRCAVVMAYHLMLETSFLLDQSAMFSMISPSEVVGLALTVKQPISVGTDEAKISGQKEPDTEQNASLMPDIPISNGFHQMGSEKLISLSEGNSSLSFQSYDPATFPGLSLSTSIQKVMNDSFPLFSDSSENITSPPDFDGRDQDGQAPNEVQVSSEPQIVDHHEYQSKFRSEVENFDNNEQPQRTESSDTWNHSDGAEDRMLSKDEISAVLDSESILVLMSSRNASRGTICEQSHFSHIKFYRSFDVPLGNFLRDNLLNQRLECKTCGESPEAHFFYYAHHNKQLTIQVRHLPANKCLPGETEGKLWMWSRCGQCKFHDGSSGSTKRVLISTAACGLSFGKFLELGFSDNSSFNCSSSCGHSFHDDFLYFFGLGPMVAMFKYSPVGIYTVSLPPRRLEFNSSDAGEFLKKDFEDVYSKGISMFLDIEKSLKDIGTQYVEANLNIQGSSKVFSDIVEMLEHEKSQFEVDIQNTVNDESEDDFECKLLSSNRIWLELLLESCIWDRRLHALLSSDLKVVDADSDSNHSLGGNDEGWIWAPFSDIRREYMEDLERGHLPKNESFSSYAAESMTQKLIMDESLRVHIPLGTNDYIVSIIEDEFSSIIACALALLKAAKSNESSTREFYYSGSHPEVSVGLGKYSVVCLYASQFLRLRERCCPSEVGYIASLSRCSHWDANGGKLKSFVAKTLDERFIIKEINRIEFHWFMKFATNYFEYMNRCYELGNHTCLAKILGIYQVVSRATKNGKETRHDLLVMENLSFGRQIDRRYILKGAHQDAQFTSSGNVLLDQNFVKDTSISPLYVTRESKQNLQSALFNDTNFLHSMNVTDYSLLVGVDIQSSQLACSIIDYLRNYTWDKQVMNWVMSAFVPEIRLPTIVPPQMFKRRLRQFIKTHFLTLPDHW